MQITIGSTIINFPESANNPNWADQIILFAEAVESALSQVIGGFDVPQTVMNIDSLVNTTSFQDVTDGVNPLAFPVAVFPASGTRSTHIKYAVYRKSDTMVAVETGLIFAVYNGSIWTWSNDGVGMNTLGTSFSDDGKGSGVVFNITASGQVQFKFENTISGGNEVGRVTYSAQSLKQS